MVFLYSALSWLAISTVADWYAKMRENETERKNAHIRNVTAEYGLI